MAKRKASDEQMNLIAKLYQLGQSMRAIALVVGISKSSVATYVADMKKAGIISDDEKLGLSKYKETMLLYASMTANSTKDKIAALNALDIKPDAEPKVARSDDEIRMKIISELSGGSVTVDEK